MEEDSINLDKNLVFGNSSVSSCSVLFPQSKKKLDNHMNYNSIYPN